jgi:hypothetical protein
MREGLLFFLRRKNEGQEMRKYRVLIQLKLSTYFFIDFFIFFMPLPFPLNIIDKNISSSFFVRNYQ